MIEYNMKELCEREHITVEEVINFFAFDCAWFLLVFKVLGG